MGGKEVEYEENSIIDFLYKDMSLINSFYSQCFNGKLNSIVKKEISADLVANEANFGLTGLLGGKILSNKTMNEAIESSIDPMDVIVIQLLEALNIKIINENLESIIRGSIVAVKGSLIFRDYNVINELLPLISETGIIPDFNKPVIDNAKGKGKSFTLGKLVERLISIIPFGTEFEVVTEKGEHITTIIKDEYLTIKRNDLIRTYGLTFPDEWTIVGILDKAPKEQLNSNSGFKTGIDGITQYYYNTMNEGSSGYVIRPIVVYRKIAV